MNAGMVGKRRWFAAVSLAVATVTALSGCFLVNDDSDDDGSSTGLVGIPEGSLVLEGNGSQVNGTLEPETPESVFFELSERSAVALGAYSPSGGDLQLRLLGDDVDVYIDDAIPALEAFSFNNRFGMLDPTIGEVLDPGTYQVDVTALGSTDAEFVLELRTGTQTLTSGEAISVSWQDQNPALVIVSLDSGGEVLETSDSTGDPKIWASAPGSSVREYDDDGGDGVEARIDFSDAPFGGDVTGDILLIVRDWDADTSGSTELALQ